MIIKNIKSFTNTALLAVLVMCCFSCSTDLYDTYDEYSEGEIANVGKAEGIYAVQGNGRLSFVVAINADPKIKKGFITWNVGEDQESFEIDRTVFQNENIEVEVVAEEGLYEFEVYLEDASGNKSISTYYIATILGEEYRASLANRTVVSVDANSDTEALITWEENVNNELLVKTEITYTDSQDLTEKTIVVDASETETIVPNFQTEGTFSYVSTYKASAESSDVFVTDATEGTFSVNID
ncbi:DUF4998 domain-containing protein [Wenyingzhuangia sp. 2_MG-2023]|uniref:DUF4998 domain-containing protein n=1 Tax=Wenyingzhuangia sp. 2_MG-2023 TaxID=3062639 RepID=UPI0026E15D13|nr:DUF4998 domain-containing protein [Wenyingzhuangia sp. 2_MG-2023]MDO6738745.1 DUF4998 domain-containing protein [Wenyingzhuangia sp. 2_MG-2023]